MPRAIDQDIDPEVHRPMRVLVNLTPKEILAVRGMSAPENVRRITHDNLDEMDRLGVVESSGPLVYRIVMAGLKDTDQIMADLGMPFDKLITQRNFPLYPDGLRDERIQVVEPGFGFTVEEGLQFLADRRLDRPSCQQGIRFAEQYGHKTTSEEKAMVLFLHEAWVGPDETPRIMYLCRGADRRRFGLMRSDYGFSERSVLAGVERRSRKYVIL